MCLCNAVGQVRMDVLCNWLNVIGQQMQMSVLQIRLLITTSSCVDFGNKLFYSSLYKSQFSL